MIQFNLLPDVKVQHIKTQKMKRVVTLVSIAAIGVSVGVLVILFSYTAVQKQHISNLDKDIASLEAELKSNDELNKILSVQNQLYSLPALYDGRPAVDRLPGFLDQTTPADVGLGQMVIDFSTSTIQMSGTATSLEAVNAHVDTLKFTTFVPEEGADKVAAFTGVVLSEFGRSDTEASFTIQFSFDPQIFDATRDIELQVPNTVTTRAQTTPAALFDGSATGDENAEQ